MKVDLLKTPGCSHSVEAEALVREVLGTMAPAASLEVVALTSEEQAVASGFAGSPTVLVDGVDLEPGVPVLSGFA